MRLIILLFISFISLFSMENICKNKDYQVFCDTTKKYIENINKSGFDKMEGVAILSAHIFSGFVPYSKEKINEINKKINKVKTYNSLFHNNNSTNKNAMVFALSFEKIGDNFYIVEAYFKNNKRNKVGFLERSLSNTLTKKAIEKVSNENSELYQPLIDYFSTEEPKQTEEEIFSPSIIQEDKPKQTEETQKDYIKELCLDNGGKKYPHSETIWDGELNIRDKDDPHKVTKDITNTSKVKLYLLTEETITITNNQKDIILYKIEIVPKNTNNERYKAYISSKAFYYKDCEEDTSNNSNFRNIDDF